MLPKIMDKWKEKIITIFTILHTHSIDMKYMHTHDNSNKGNVKLIICHNKLWIILKEMGIPNHLTCLLRNLYAGQEATARTGHGTTWTRSKLGKEYIKAVYSHPAYLLICKVHHAKCQIGLITSWNQDCWEKYQPPHICRWYHSNGRKQRGSKKAS